MCVLWEKEDYEKDLNVVFVWRVLGRMKEKDLVLGKKNITRRCVRVGKLVF